MTARILEDFQVLDRYRVMVLDRDAVPDSSCYKINGILFDPVPIHSKKETDTMPKNYIAIRYKGCLKGQSVEFIPAIA